MKQLKRPTSVIRATPAASLAALPGGRLVLPSVSRVGLFGQSGANV
jgi:hypothetical protein